MQNILFVLYQSFYANSAVHVHHFANYLTQNGHDCIVAVPDHKESVSVVGQNLYKVANFAETSQLDTFFSNGTGPDIVHAWTPREIVRKQCERLRSIYNFKLLIHLEDNEEHLLEKAVGKSFQEITEDSISDYVSHPIEYRRFLAKADGVTVIMDRLQEFVPKHVPTLILWPGVNTEIFAPKPKSTVMMEKLGVPLNSVVLCYTGNVHFANTNEVRSLYLATAMMNREGQPTVLLRTGKDYCGFLGSDDRWARKYAIELGFVDRSILPQILALADVLIQPGKSDDFNDYRFPSKLPEFLAMGKPVILPASNIGRFMENMKDAIVLPVVDALNIIAAIKLVINDKNLYDKLGQNALSFAKNYLDWSKNGEKLKSFYQTICQDSST